MRQPARTRYLISRSTKRDLTDAQLEHRLAKLGFVRVGILGYYELPAPCNNVSVSALNAGDRNRDRLAYLMRRWKEERARRELTTRMVGAVATLPPDMLRELPPLSPALGDTP